MTHLAQSLWPKKRTVPPAELLSWIADKGQLVIALKDAGLMLPSVVVTQSEVSRA